MKLELQTIALSKATDNDLSKKIHNDVESRKKIAQNIKLKNFATDKKIEVSKKIELELLNKQIPDISKYLDYNAAQISNITRGLKANIDITFYDDINFSAQEMTLRRLILIYNKENPNSRFNLDYFNGRNNANKIAILFDAHKFNVSNPDRMIDLEELVNMYNIKDAKQKLAEHKAHKPETDGVVRSVEIEVKKEPVKKAPQVIEKDSKNMSFGELAELWNQKHPKAQINADFIYAQPNKKMQEMVYIASIYNLKFKNNRVSMKIFIENQFTTDQKDEILAGLKYNLKNSNSTIPVEKYINSEIPAGNMRIINKIMRLIAEYNVQADIDFIMSTNKDRKSLNEVYDKLFKTKEVENV